MLYRPAKAAAKPLYCSVRQTFEPTKTLTWAARGTWPT